MGLYSNMVNTFMFWRLGDLTRHRPPKSIYLTRPGSCFTVTYPQ